MMNDSIKYAADEDHKKPVLQKISDFIYREAESLVAAGVLSFSSYKVNQKKKSQRRAKNDHNSYRAVFVTNVDENVDNVANNQANFQGGRCVQCDHSDHQLSDCKNFIKDKLVMARSWKCKRISKEQLK